MGDQGSILNTQKVLKIKNPETVEISRKITIQAEKQYSKVLKAKTLEIVEISRV